MTEAEELDVVFNDIRNDVYSCASQAQDGASIPHRLIEKARRLRVDAHRLGVDGGTAKDCMKAAACERKAKILIELANLIISYR